MAASAKHDLFRLFARVGRAVASAARLELLDLLAQGEKSVDMLARQAGLSVTNTSNHLKELRMSGLVASRREGQRVHYRLADPAVHDFLRCLQDIARRQLAEVEQILRNYFAEPGTLEPVRAAELMARMRTHDVVVVDVRPEDEYRSGHIPGALSIPVGELERRLDELPRDSEVVAYCRGPYCVLAVRAVAMLRARGFRARRLEDGVPDWRAGGHRVAMAQTIQPEGAER